jgi:hypothetical protein
VRGGFAALWLLQTVVGRNERLERSSIRRERTASEPLRFYNIFGLIFGYLTKIMTIWNALTEAVASPV